MLLSCCWVLNNSVVELLLSCCWVGVGKRTDISEYRLQSRGGIGVKAAKVDEGARGGLVGALIVNESNEILGLFGYVSRKLTECEKNILIF